MYQPINKLPARARDLSNSEIPAVKKVIEAYHPYIPTEDKKIFETRIAREWAIETGQIEGLYQFDRGVTMTLLEEGIVPSRIPKTASQMSPEQVAAILGDHINALDGLFAFVKGERRLSKSYIHELHVALLRNQTHHTVFTKITNSFFDKELTKGQYKSDSNSPTRPDGSTLEFCPPEHVEAEMDNLLKFHSEHEGESWPVEIRAAWLHHAFTHIHPYPDGNGRVARALATLVLIREGLLPLVVPSSEKQTTYIPSLENADLGDYESLVTALRNWQGRLLVQLSQQVRFTEKASRPSTLDQFFESIQVDLMRTGLTMPSEWRRVDSHIRTIQTRAVQHFNVVSTKLTSQIKPDGGGWHFGLGETGLNSHETKALSELGYEFVASKTQVLQLHTKVPTEVCFTSGTIGPKLRGLGAAAITFRRIRSDQASILGYPFLINFEESQQDVEARFEIWIAPLILAALEEWRKLQFEA